MLGSLGDDLMPSIAKKSILVRREVKGETIETISFNSRFKLQTD